MKNLTTAQIFSIILVILGVLVASTGQLNDLFGPTVTKYVVSAAGLMVSMVSGISTILTGQGAQVRDVAAMPGIEPIQINAQANKTVAALAVDPTLDKIEIKPGAEVAVSTIAKAD